MAAASTSPVVAAHVHETQDERWIEIMAFRDCEIGGVREAGTNPVRDSAWIIYRIEVS